MSDEEHAPEPEIEVLGIKEADYQAWKHHPVTKMFRQYLDDYKSVLLEDHQARWLVGELGESDAESRGRVIGLGEIATLEFHHISAFYQDPNE